MKMTLLTWDETYSVNVNLIDGQHKKLFNLANGYSIAWSNELEIDATTIYSELTGKNFGEILSPKLSHATN